jgi:tetratricopeptide (TPR) repeat protein
MWQHYPMGPEVQKWLGFAPLAANVDPELRAAAEQQKPGFIEFVLNYAADHPLAEMAQLTRLLDELLAMDLPAIAVKIAQLNPEACNHNDLQFLLAHGAAAMLCEEFALAEACFRRAQALAPLEPAPYINAIQIMQAEERWDEAWQWCMACIEVEPNHFPLWQLLARSIEKREGDLKSEISTLAQRFNSWAGMSLAADLTASETPSLKVDYLKTFYEAGEASAPFLVEYTGALGAADLYEGIPAIVWRAKKLLGATSLPWKLLLHGAQAQLALGNEAAFREAAAILQKRKDLPPAVHQYLQELVQA